MATIKDIGPRELSLIFAEHKGENWSPVNPDAKVLLVKGGTKDGLTVAGGSKGFLAKFGDRLKSLFGAESVEETDKASPNDERCGLVANLYYDLCAAAGIGDAEAREAAISAALDNFDEAWSGSTATKAGRRHSSTDQAHINAISDAHSRLVKIAAQADKVRAGMKEHIDALAVKNQSPNEDAEGQDESGKAKLVVDPTVEAGTVIVDRGDLGEDGDPSSYTMRAATQELLDANADFLEKAKEGKYGDVEYADAKNKKYPIDTEEHIRAAWSYINMPKNAEKYDSDELATIKSKIRAAMKRIGADVEDDKGAVVASDTGEIVKAAVESAKDELQASLRVELGEAIAKAKEESDAAIAALKATHESEKAELQTKIDDANALVATAVKEAARPTSPGGIVKHDSDGTRKDPFDDPEERRRAAKAEIAEAVKTPGTTVGQVIKLQRAASR